jgi:zinc protease
MRFIFSGIVILIALHLNAQTSENKIFKYPIHKDTLSNGLGVVTVPYTSPGIAAFYIVVKVGSRDEIEPGKTGFAHFFEHMMFRGTDKYPKDKYAEVLKSTGAGANANTSRDRTVYHMTGSADKLETMFEVEADRFKNLKYSVQDFKTEAGAVKGEYTKNFANPLTQLNEKLVGTAFTSHTYAHTTMGFFEDIVDMPNQYEYSLEFFDRFYRPEYSTIIVVGDVTHNEVMRLSKKYFGDWQRGKYTSPIPQEPEQKETRTAHIKVNDYPPYLSLNYKGPAFDVRNKEHAAINLLLSVLFSEKSDLYKKLVLNEQVVRSLRGGYYFTVDPYLISISASVKKEKDMQYVKDEILSAIEAIRKTPPDESLLKEFVSREKYSFAMRMDSPDRIANTLAFYIWVTGDARNVNNYYSLLDKVTPEDISNAARKYFTKERLTIGTISSAEYTPVQ